MSALALLALLVSLLLPVTAVSLGAHSGMSFEASMCRSQPDGGSSGSGAEGAACFCPSACVMAYCAGIGTRAGAFEIVWRVQPVVLTPQTDEPKTVHRIVLAPAVRGPPLFI